MCGKHVSGLSRLGCETVIVGPQMTESYYYAVILRVRGGTGPGPVRIAELELTAPGQAPRTLSPRATTVESSQTMSLLGTEQDPFEYVYYLREPNAYLEGIRVPNGTWLLHVRFRDNRGESQSVHATATLLPSYDC